MLEGKFSNCQVDEVLGAVVQGTGTGRLTLEGTSVFGGHVQETFYIEKGRIVHFDAGSEAGHIPIVDLFCLREGSFAFTGGETSQIKDQSLPVTELILQVTAALDEWNSVQQQISSMNAVFQLHAEGATSDLVLTVSQWDILAHLDGKASLQEIARSLGVSEVAVARVVADFLHAGLVGEVQAPVAAEERAGERTERRGFFDLRRRR